jgi:DNA-binding MarR family transcriptional regulator
MALEFEKHLVHTKGVNNLMTLTPEQYDLLCDAANAPILQTFSHPRNPSDVAKSLGVPANSMHYRVNKLHAAGLLNLVSENGRRRTYQSVATRFRVHQSVLFNRGERPSFPEDALTRVSTSFAVAQTDYIEKHINDGDDPDYVHFDIRESSSPDSMVGFEPCLSIFEMPLSQAQYERLSKALLKIIDEIKKEPTKRDTKQCTVALVAFAGGSMIPKVP